MVRDSHGGEPQVAGRELGERVLHGWAIPAVLVLSACPLLLLSEALGIVLGSQGSSVPSDLALAGLLSEPVGALGHMMVDMFLWPEILFAFVFGAAFGLFLCPPGPMARAVGNPARPAPVVVSATLSGGLLGAYLMTVVIMMIVVAKPG